MKSHPELLFEFRMAFYNDEVKYKVWIFVKIQTLVRVTGLEPVRP